MLDEVFHRELAEYDLTTAEARARFYDDLAGLLRAVQEKLTDLQGDLEEHGEELAEDEDLPEAEALEEEADALQSAADALDEVIDALDEAADAARG